MVNEPAFPSTTTAAAMTSPGWPLAADVNHRGLLRGAVVADGGIDAATIAAELTLGIGRSGRRILLATDLSPASGEATTQALELATILGGQLLIVSVIDTSTHLRAATPVVRLDQRRAAREASAQALVVRGRNLGVNVTFLVWDGEPGPSIVDAAASEQVDMVVVGSHGRGVVGRFALGSVSDYVVRHAPCPVLVVRGRAGPG